MGQIRDRVPHFPILAMGAVGVAACAGLSPCPLVVSEHPQPFQTPFCEVGIGVGVVGSGSAMFTPRRHAGAGGA